MDALIDHILTDALYVGVYGFVFVFFSVMVGWVWPLRLVDRIVRKWGYQRLTFDEEMAVARHRTERDAQ